MGEKYKLSLPILFILLKQIIQVAVKILEKNPLRALALFVKTWLKWVKVFGQQ